MCLPSPLLSALIAGNQVGKLRRQALGQLKDQARDPAGSQHSPSGLRERDLLNREAKRGHNLCSRSQTSPGLNAPTMRHLFTQA